MNFKFNSSQKLSLLAIEKGLYTWQELVIYIQQLPYARNKNRHDLSLVLLEQKGTCSSKHAFLKAIADENNRSNIQLILGMYKMSSKNTNIGTVLDDKKLEYIPEAHCYLKIDDKRVDITSENADFDKITHDIITEISIQPHQISIFKVDYHQNFIKKWITELEIQYSFDEIWDIREQCIAFLSQ